MRYTHGIHAIRSRKHVFKFSLIISFIILVLVFLLGFSELNAQKFFVGFAESLSRVTIAYFIALFLAVIISLGVTSSRVIEDIFVPVLDVLQSFPSFALFPLLVLWFGKSSVVTILILILAMIWPILFTILTSQKQIKESLSDAAKIYQAKNYKYTLYVLFPLIFPAVITGSLVAWGEAWETIIAAEIIVNIQGVGSYLADVAGSSRPEKLAIGIILLLLLLFLINKYIWLPLLNISTKYNQE